MLRPPRAFFLSAQTLCSGFCLAAGIGLFLRSSDGAAADPMAGRTPPGGLPGFQKVLSHFDLEIPVAKGSGVMSVSTLSSDPDKGFASGPGYGNYFWAAGNHQMVFMVPPNGATTPGSRFPRTELKQKQEERWTVASGDHALRGTFAVASVPKITDKGEITVAQIHDNISDKGPLLKLICDYRARPWKLLAEYRMEPKKSSVIRRTPDAQQLAISADSPVDYEIILSSNHVLTVRARISGMPMWTALADSSQAGKALSAAWDSETCYFKAGCYMFDPGAATEPVGKICYSALSLE